jgi:hypothetical protein
MRKFVLYLIEKSHEWKISVFKSKLNKAKVGIPHATKVYSCLNVAKLSQALVSVSLTGKIIRLLL